MKRSIEAIVSLLRCEAKEHLTPHLTLIGDTDMLTAGLATLSSAIKREIVIAELDATELADHSGLIFENRINSLLHRDDLRFLKLSRVDRVALPNGLSFQEFRERYSSPRLVFACPTCGADATAVGAVAPAEFKRNGGTLTALDGLEVRD